MASANSFAISERLITRLTLRKRLSNDPAKRRFPTKPRKIEPALWMCHHVVVDGSLPLMDNIMRAVPI